MGENKYTSDFPIQFFKNAEKPPSEWKIGLEQELFGFYRNSLKRVSYTGGIKKLLEGFVKRFGWEPSYEGGNIISIQRGENQLTLEPGGQIELSTKPFTTISSIQEEYQIFKQELLELSREDDFIWLSIGYDSFSRLEDIPWVPKKRYSIMRDYLPQFGDRVHHMMLATCAIQSSYDYKDEEDMRKKMLVTSAFSPIVSSLFTTSGIQEQKPSKVSRLRGWAWAGIDPCRTGILDFVFHPSFGYEDYIRYIKEIPMMFIVRDGVVIDMRGKDFNLFLKNGFQEYEATEADWITQMGSVFPVSRLRNFIETRTGDAGSESMNLAQAAFWKGLLYAPESLETALNLAREIGFENCKNLYQLSISQGLNTSIGGLSLFELCNKMTEIARQGLLSVAESQKIEEETSFLDPIFQILERKQTVADRLQQTFSGGDKNKLLEVLTQYDLILK